MKPKNEFFFVNGDQELILGTPNGERFALKADDAGALSMTNEKTGESVPVGGGSGGVTWVEWGDNDGLYLSPSPDELTHHLTKSEFMELYNNGRISLRVGHRGYLCVGYQINSSAALVSFGGGEDYKDREVVFASE